MLRQACAIARDLGSSLQRLDTDGFKIIFVGHSLGGAVAALAGAVVRLGLEGPKVPHVQSLCYATPACCDIAVAKFCESHAISVINDDDVVPRLSLETARRLRVELDERREITRVYVKEDIDALKNVQNITEKKRRVNVTSSALENAPETAQELAALGIPAPRPEVEAAEEKRAAEATRKAAEKAAAECKPKAKAKRKKGFCLCGSIPDTEDTDGEERQAEAELEPDEPDAPETDDPAEVWMYPPGRLVHLYRHCGVRRAVWIKRSHPTLHHIEVLTGIADGHKSIAYKQSLEEARMRAQGATPAQWKPFGEVYRCACCNSDFAWASVLRSEPHRLQSRHHCHSCGDVVCDGCSQNKRPLPRAGIMREVRVCDRCHLNAGGETSRV
jgi:pimeloyl-ACP methyl ester carboxylesterase